MAAVSTRSYYFEGYFVTYNNTKPDKFITHLGRAINALCRLDHIILRDGGPSEVETIWSDSIQGDIRDFLDATKGPLGEAALKLPAENDTDGYAAKYAASHHDLVGRALERFSPVKIWLDGDVYTAVFYTRGIGPSEVMVTLDDAMRYVEELYHADISYGTLPVQWKPVWNITGRRELLADLDSLIGEGRQTFTVNKRTRGYKNQLASLPPQVQAQAQRTFERFLKDHDSVDFQNYGKVSRPDMWRVEVGNRYRAIGRQIAANAMLWWWIGSHEDYNKTWLRAAQTQPREV